MKKSELRKIIREEINSIILIEKYKWKPSQTQKREFTKKMQDDDFKKSYYDKKEKIAQKKRSSSKFSYMTAGGYYIPTKSQYDFAIKNDKLFKTQDERMAKNQVIYGYINKEKISHDYIHIVNEKIRTKRDD